jgi:uncharacterized membrane protein
MIESINEYLNQLRQELAGSDRATVQDAISDAEEHLRTALESMVESNADILEAEAIPLIVEEYGSPEETASAYREIEARVRPTLARPRKANGRPFYVRWLAVFAEPRAWGALLYMLFSCVTGMIYFTWAIGGLSLSLSLLVLIIGIPFMILFLLSVRGVALVEGRLVEALLGVRMPRRPAFLSSSNTGWMERLKALLLDRCTWLAIIYMVFQLPLGILYFTVFLVLLSVSVSFIAMPVLGILNIAVITIGRTHYIPPDWATPFFTLAGVALLAATMHLAKVVGRVHGMMAKAMLVSE